MVFKVDGLSPKIPSGEYYIKRIAGEPGDQVLISDGKLFINHALVTLSNSMGPIAYYPSPHYAAFMAITNLTVPAGQYYVLGDRSTNSYDSRSWGTLPAENIIGRIRFCYWPLGHIGGVK